MALRALPRLEPETFGGRLELSTTGEGLPADEIVRFMYTLKAFLSDFDPDNDSDDGSQVEAGSVSGFIVRDPADFESYTNADTISQSASELAWVAHQIALRGEERHGYPPYWAVLVEAVRLEKPFRGHGLVPRMLKNILDIRGLDEGVAIFTLYPSPIYDSNEEQERAYGTAQDKLAVEKLKNNYRKMGFKTAKGIDNKHMYWAEWAQR